MGLCVDLTGAYHIVVLGIVVAKMSEMGVNAQHRPRTVYNEFYINTYTLQCEFSRKIIQCMDDICKCDKLGKRFVFSTNLVR